MSEFIISTDACVNLPKSLRDRYDVPIVPMPFSLNEPNNNNSMTRVDYMSNTCKMSMVEFYDKLTNGAVPLTSQANASITAEYLEPYLKEGKDILHISFSSGMSGTYNSACIAMKELRQKYPDRKIFVVDSLSGGAGEGLAVVDAYKQMELGKSIEEVRDYVEAEKLRYHHYFVVGTPKFIAKSGRISSFQELVVTLLGIQIILGIDSEGKVYPAGKVRGKKKVISKLLELYEEYNDRQDNSEIMIGHCNALDEAKKLGELLQNENPSIKHIDYDFVNMLVGCNSGPGTIAVFFKGEKRTFVQNK